MISVAETIPNGPFTNIGFLSALNTPPFVSLYYTEKQIVRRRWKVYNYSVDTELANFIPNDMVWILSFLEVKIDTS